MNFDSWIAEAIYSFCFVLFFQLSSKIVLSEVHWWFCQGLGGSIPPSFQPWWYRAFALYLDCHRREVTGFKWYLGRFTVKVMDSGVPISCCHTTRWVALGTWFNLSFPICKLRFYVQSYQSSLHVSYYCGCCVYCCSYCFSKPKSFPNVPLEGLVRRDANSISKFSWKERWGEGTHLRWCGSCYLLSKKILPDWSHENYSVSVVGWFLCAWFVFCLFITNVSNLVKRRSQLWILLVISRKERLEDSATYFNMRQEAEQPEGGNQPIAGWDCPLWGC